ncbi:MAG: TIGR03943 family protein [Clostridiales Family XIII bacterium]|jgi:putative membrane protein|nr:TIGR03943 family protein [Clostridiales Family XIII bacterium]
MRARAFNPQVFLEIVCHMSFSVLTFYLVYSGKYLTYVTPRMAPYLYFMAIVMLLWACAGAFRLFRPKNRVRVAHCFVPVIPILLLLLPHSALSAADLTYNYAGGGALAGPSAPIASVGAAPASSANGTANPSLADPGALPEDTLRASDEAVPAAGTDATADGPATGPSASAATEAPIEVGDDEFYAWLNELYANLELYEGRRIAVTGFVFKDPEMFGADEFVPARLGMTCCVADLVPYGLICKYDKAGELEADAWVRVEGVIQAGEYEGAEEPQIAVTSVEPADPVEGYIYPFY